MRLLIPLVVLGILLPSLLGHLSAYYWAFDLLAQFQHYALLAGALLLLVALGVKHKKLRLFSLAIMISSGAVVLPVMLETGPRATSGAAKIISYNVLSQNPDQAAVAAWLQEEQADVVALIEANHLWNETADKLRDLYPHQYRLDDEANFGQMLLSRVPLENVQVIHGNTPFHSGMIEADLTLAGRPLRLVLAHPIPPLSSVYKEARDSQIRSLIKLVQESPRPMVLLGDFNASPWTSIMREFITSAKLQGLNVRPTWLAGSYLFAFPIDHILTSQGATIRFGGLSPVQGSDHRAVIGWLQ